MAHSPAVDPTRGGSSVSTYTAFTTVYKRVSAAVAATDRFPVAGSDNAATSNSNAVVASRADPVTPEAGHKWILLLPQASAFFPGYCMSFTSGQQTVQICAKIPACLL